MVLRCLYHQPEIVGDFDCLCENELLVMRSCEPPSYVVDEIYYLFK